jgi:hypothetical protein
MAQSGAPGIPSNDAKKRIGFVDCAKAACAPIVSLALGYVGALAIVAVSALLADARRLAALGRLGSRSIDVYLAFFLPMAARRILIVQMGVVEDVGVASLAFAAPFVEAGFGGRSPNTEFYP